MTAPRVLFDHGPGGRPVRFADAYDLIRADAPDQVDAAFAAMQAARDAGKWLAGYASYELGYVFSHKLRDLMPVDRTAPLLMFGVFDGPEPHDFTNEKSGGLSPLLPQWDQQRYADAFDVVHDYIAAGDIYQANLTFELQGSWHGSLEAVYAGLRARQSAPFGAFVDLGGDVLLSRSPELFFGLDADGGLTTRPMKGTAPRGGNALEDAAQISWLNRSEKNRAENLMIVDLLRNDMSRVSEVGTVRVPQLFEVETYETLHQMTSTIASRIRQDVGLREIFEALFPCGSITGAPKIRAMQIIAALEARARNGYCGAIGWIGPDGGMQFNVAIRTLICAPDGGVRLSVGGGVVYDSDAETEYHEALLKARFAGFAPESTV
ncbi:MAG: aminodeoxychorismate synthase component I [Pseudomonadota bacterium]